MTMTNTRRSRVAGGALGLLLALAVAVPAAAAPPANDDFLAAPTVDVPGIYRGTVLDATTELGEKTHFRSGPYRSVWYRFRSTCSCRLTLDTAGSAFDTTLAVYTGSDLPSLTLVANDDDDSPTQRLGSTVRFEAERGKTYRVAIDSYRSALEPSGDYELTISDASIEGKGVTLTVDEGQTVSSVRSAGLRLVAGARRQVPVRIELVVTRRVARRLGLKSRVLGRTGGELDYGQQLRARIGLTPSARTALRGRSRLSATVRLTLRNHAPNRVLNVPVQLGG
jgi:hypothetical protein